MTKLNYELVENDVCLYSITPCKYYYIQIGSEECEKCKYHKSNDILNNIVECTRYESLEEK